jgi:hypothetical protein
MKKKNEKKKSGAPNLQLREDRQTARTLKDSHKTAVHTVDGTGFVTDIFVSAPIVLLITFGNEKKKMKKKKKKKKVKRTDGGLGHPGLHSPSQYADNMPQLCI